MNYRCRCYNQHNDTHFVRLKFAVYLYVYVIGLYLFCYLQEAGRLKRSHSTKIAGFYQCSWIKEPWTDHLVRTAHHTKYTHKQCAANKNGKKMYVTS